MPNFIKRVRQVANERWDLPDAANAIMELVAEGIARAEAGDLGVAEGVLSRSEVTFEEPSPGVYQLRFGGCLLYGCKPDDTPSNLSSAVPVVYDPANTNQIQSTVDITSLDGSEGAVWWSVELVPYELANRRVWEEDYPDGRIQPINTRQYPRVTFSVTSGNNFNTPPGVGGPWYRFAAVDFNANPPTTVLCHALDYGFEHTAFEVAAGTVGPNFWLGQIALANRAAGTNSGRSYSVARLLTTLALSFQQLKNSNFTYDPETGEILTTGGADATLLTEVDQGVMQLNDTARSGLAWIGTLTWNGGTPAYELAETFTNDTVTVTLTDGNDAWGNNGVRAVLTLDAGVGYEVIHVSAEIANVITGAGTGDFVVPATAVDGTLPLSTSFEVEVGAWDPSEAVALDKPTVANIIDVLVYTAKT